MPEKSLITIVAEKINQLPEFARPYLLTKIIGRSVPFVGTSGIIVEKLTSKTVIMRLPNKRGVRNHIGGVHAAATALLAESTSGMLTALNLPKDKLPLLKSMNIDYTQRAAGNLKAVAKLSVAQARQLQKNKSGKISIPVTITDEKNNKPVEAIMVWAWIPKSKEQAA